MIHSQKTSHDSETPAVGQQVITACAFIHHNFNGIEKLFLPRRAKTKKFLPDVFELPGGHIDFGEDLHEGLKREIREEINMEIKIGDVFWTFTYKNDIKQSHSVEIIFFAEFIGDIENIKLNPEDHSEYVWMAENEIESVLARTKQPEDLEYKGIQKGFELLRGEKLKFN